MLHSSSRGLASLLALTDLFRYDWGYCPPPPMVIFAPAPTRNIRKGGRRLTGKRYPHSSTRQQERNARQLAAGQLKVADGSA